MSGCELLTVLWEKGIGVTAADGRLRLEAPRGVLTSELRAKVAEHKGEMLALLGEPVVAAWVGLRLSIEDLPSFKEQWGLGVVAAAWPEGAPCPVFTMVPARGAEGECGHGDATCQGRKS